TVQERSERFFSALGRMSKRPGQRLSISREYDFTLTYSEGSRGGYSYGGDVREFTFFCNLLRDLKWISIDELASTHAPDDLYVQIQCSITPEGWAELQSKRSRNLESLKVFVAMSFDPTLKPAYQCGIAAAIEDVGFRPVRIDFEHFAGDIVDRIMATIRESR